MTKAQKARAIASLLQEIKDTRSGSCSLNEDKAGHLRAQNIRQIAQLNGWPAGLSHNDRIRMMDRDYPGWRGYDAPVLLSPSLINK